MHRVSQQADDLSDALRAINVRSMVFCRSDFTAPWGFRVDETAMAKFHLVLRGSADLVLDAAADPYHLVGGDVVLVPHGTSHALTDGPGSPTPGLDDILVDNPVDDAGRMSYGGGGATTTIVCGGFGAAALPDELIEQLPRVLVLGERSGNLNRWLQPMTTLLADEAPPLPGEAAILAKVVDVLLTEMLRQYLGSQRVLRPQVSSDSDAPIATALRMMRADPGCPWTVPRLAHAVGLSRTAFAARFRHAVGEPPMTHLTRLRLNSGAGYLSTTTRTIGDIAREIGYDNEASFSKAFKRTYGRSPGAFRTEWTA